MLLSCHICVHVPLTGVHAYARQIAPAKLYASQTSMNWGALLQAV